MDSDNWICFYTNVLFDPHESFDRRFEWVMKHAKIDNVDALLALDDNQLKRLDYADPTNGNHILPIPAGFRNRIRAFQAFYTTTYNKKSSVDVLSITHDEFYDYMASDYDPDAPVIRIPRVPCYGNGILRQWDNSTNTMLSASPTQEDKDSHSPVDNLVDGDDGICDADDSFPASFASKNWTLARSDISTDTMLLSMPSGQDDAPSSFVNRPVACYARPYRYEDSFVLYSFIGSCFTTTLDGESNPIDFETARVDCHPDLDHDYGISFRVQLTVRAIQVSVIAMLPIPLRWELWLYATRFFNPDYGGRIKKKLNSLLVVLSLSTMGGEKCQFFRSVLWGVRNVIPLRKRESVVTTDLVSTRLQYAVLTLVLVLYPRGSSLVGPNSPKTLVYVGYSSSLPTQ
jgi:hypothetical protein